MSVTFYAENIQEELNVANGNAPTVLRLMGFYEKDPYVGLISVKEIPSALRNLIKAQNIHSKILEETMSPYQEGNIVECGRTKEQINRYIEVLIKMCQKAVVNNVPIQWI